MTRLNIRCCSASEVDLLLQWAAAEGWNPGLEDSQPFLVADPEGYQIGVWENRPIAGISAVRYPGQYAFLGLVLDVPEPNQEAIHLAEQWGLRPAFETARMYLGNPPEVNLREIFGISTFELG